MTRRFVTCTLCALLISSANAGHEKTVEEVENALVGHQEITETGVPGDNNQHEYLPWIDIGMEPAAQDEKPQLAVDDVRVEDVEVPATEVASFKKFMQAHQGLIAAHAREEAELNAKAESESASAPRPHFHLMPALGAAGFLGLVVAALFKHSRSNIAVASSTPVASVDASNVQRL